MRGHEAVRRNLVQASIEGSASLPQVITEWLDPPCRRSFGRTSVKFLQAKDGRGESARPAVYRRRSDSRCRSVSGGGSPHCFTYSLQSAMGLPSAPVQLVVPSSFGYEASPFANCTVKNVPVTSYVPLRF